MEINRYYIPSPIEVVNAPLGAPLSYRQKCIDEIYKIGDKQNNQTNVKASMSSWWVEKESKILNSLSDQIMDAIGRLMPLAPEYKYILYNCWSNIYKKGQHTVPHIHKPFYISFIYYLKSDKDSSPLIFNSSNFIIQPQDDMLVIFPSYIEHSVPKHNSDEDRICVAGNINWVPKDNK